MIVWLASYPRSGNTFLRIVLHRLYGVPTYSIYDDNDPVAQRVGPELVGYRPKPGDRELMRNGPELFFTKTHKRHKGDNHAAIYLVRDGRDAVVSRARFQASEKRPAGGDSGKPFEVFLYEAITRPYLAGQPSSGTWGGNVLSWLDVTNAPVAVLRYEDLVHDPCRSVSSAVSSLLPDLVPFAGADIPSFDALRRLDGTFFRFGAALSYKDEMPEDLHELFWAQPENALAMQRLGYCK